MCTPRQRLTNSDTVAWVSPNAGPRVVFAQGESAGSTKQIATTGPILIVEDDFLVSMEIEAALAEAGFEIAGVAVSAEEAVELALEKVPILVIMDIRLAGKRHSQAGHPLGLQQRITIRTAAAQCPSLRRLGCPSPRRRRLWSRRPSGARELGSERP